MIRGVSMGKHYGEKILSEVLNLKSQGFTHNEIAKQFGLQKEQITELIKRYNKNTKKRLLGVEIKPKGRPATRNLTSHQKLELENKRLQTENDLLRSFLRAAGRM